MRPVLEMQFADFISCAFDQIVNTAATLRYRHGGRVACPLVVRAPSGGGVHGAIFHSQNPEAWFTRVPGLKVVAPATPYDAKGLLKSAIRDNNPVIYFEHKRLYRSVKEDLPEGDFTVPIGAAEVRQNGRDISIITYGGTVHQCLDAARIVEKENGLSVEVLDLRTLLPLDREAILATARKTGKVLVVHEDRLTGASAVRSPRSSVNMPSTRSTVRSGGWPRPIRIRRLVLRSRSSYCLIPTRSQKRSAAWRRTEMAVEVTMPQMGRA